MNQNTGSELFGSLYEKGEVIFRQGDPGDTMFVIQSGTVEISQTERNKESVIAILEKGAFFGEIALLRGGPRSATARAAGKTRLLPLTGEAILQRIPQDPGVAFHLLQGLTFKIYRADQRLQQMIHEDEDAPAPADESGEKVAAEDGVESTRPAEEESRKEPAADLSFHELAEVWAMAENSTWVEAGQKVFIEGDAGDAMYIVLDGEVEITQGQGHERRILTRLGQGSFFGELAIIAETTRSADATALGRVRLMTVSRSEFRERIAVNPELALFLIKSLIDRLRQKEANLADPQASKEVGRKSWVPVFKKSARVRVAIVSLSTCAGCSAVLLDDEVLAQVMEHTEITFCPMLMDQAELPDVDVALVDGAVRLKDDAEKLEEARAKSRFLVAWGTCAASGGIPAEANRYELEELIEQTYGHAEDAFAHYLSGKGGVGRETYQGKGVALLRQAGKLDDLVRVDYYLPGCPPQPFYLLQLIGELTGNEFQKAKPLVCAECGRKVSKSDVAALRSFPLQQPDPCCFHSQGVLCAGFMTKGGCGAVCTRNGSPCWGCRGPAQTVFTKMAEGNSFEEILVANLGRRCLMEENEMKPLVKQLHRQSHNRFDFDQNTVNTMRRIR